MNRATLALLVAALLFGAAILAFVLTSGGSTRVVRTQTTVVEVPPLTPLRDSGPKNNPQVEKPSRTSSSRLPSVNSVPSPSSPQNRSLPVKKRPAPKTTPSPRPSSSGGSTAPQPSSPQPSQPPPVVGVTAPAPVTVCARPVATVNC